MPDPVSISGTDLVITKANSDLSDTKTGSITIQNFPFENEHGAFGITLGKTADLALDENGDVISTTGYDLVDKALPSNHYILGGPFIQTERDFSGVLMQRDGSSSTDRMILGRFNSYADEIATQTLNDDVPVTSVGAPTQYVDPSSGKVFTAVTFSSRYFFSSSLGEISTNPDERTAGETWQS